MFDEVFVYHKDRTDPNITFFLKACAILPVLFKRDHNIFKIKKKETLKKLYVTDIENYMFLHLFTYYVNTKFMLCSSFH